MKYCPSCGDENIDEAQFCRNCGYRFSEEKSEEPSDIKVKVENDDSSIISKLFFKKDARTGRMRFAKTKSISIFVFVVMFFFEVYVNFNDASVVTLILAGIAFALIFAVPVYIIGFIVGVVLDKFLH